MIYEDKEESFNINFASDSNLFGRGIYFAKEAAYSHTYTYLDKVKANNYLLLVRVLLGDIQPQCKVNADIRDTDYKDEKGKIKYDSRTALTEIGDIYVIYRSRRAYPEYIIEYAANI